MPAAQPPTAEKISEAVATRPAWPLLIPHAVINVGMTKVYTMTSSASTDQPPNAAMNVLRSADESARNQSNILSPFIVCSSPRRQIRSGALCSSSISQPLPRAYHGAGPMLDFLIRQLDLR